jgi:hypothetical protein
MKSPIPVKLNIGGRRITTFDAVVHLHARSELSGEMLSFRAGLTIPNVG